MRRITATSAVALAAAATTASLVAPWEFAAGLLVVAFAATRRSHVGRFAFAASAIAINIALFGFLVAVGTATQVGPFPFHPTSAATGAITGIRLAAAVAANLAIFDWLPAVQVLDGLGLPRRTTAFLGAVVLGAHGVGEDARHLAIARRLEAKPRGVPSRIRHAAGMMAPLMVTGLRRATTRHDALRLAGYDMGATFTPVVAISALAIAGRLAFAAVPNVSPTYAIVFLGGVLFGARAGAMAGALSMAITNLTLSGLYVPPFANVPAMALLGLMGGLLRHLDWTGANAAGRWGARLLAAGIGYLGTLVFSVASDAFTWLLSPEARATPGSLQALILAGLAFNLIPAAANAVLFAFATPSTVHAWRVASELRPARSPGRPARAALSPH